MLAKVMHGGQSNDWHIEDDEHSPDVGDTGVEGLQLPLMGSSPIMVSG